MCKQTCRCPSPSFPPDPRTGPCATCGGCHPGVPTYNVRYGDAEDTTYRALPLSNPNYVDTLRQLVARLKAHLSTGAATPTPLPEPPCRVQVTVTGQKRLSAGQTELTLSATGAVGKVEYSLDRKTYSATPTLVVTTPPALVAVYVREVNRPTCESFVLVTLSGGPACPVRIQTIRYSA